MLPKRFVSTKVEHAPNTPKNGIFKSLKPKLEEIHWLIKSPAKHISTSLTASPDLLITSSAVSLTNLLSAFSQDSSPQNSSSIHLSKYLARGPSFSLGPTIQAVSKIDTLFSNW